MRQNKSTIIEIIIHDKNLHEGEGNHRSLSSLDLGQGLAFFAVVYGEREPEREFVSHISMVHCHCHFVQTAHFW